MKIIGAIAGVLCAVCGALFFLVVQPGSSGVVASLRLADGSEYMVTQKCNWSTEPYTVGFYMRPPGGGWGWCYMDHEARRWRDVAMTHDTATDTIVVTERGVWRAALDRPGSTFSMDNGSIRRELLAPQSNQSPGYPFP